MPVRVPDPAEYVADGAARQAAWVLAGTAQPPVWEVAGTRVYGAGTTSVVMAQYSQAAQEAARRSR